MRALGRDKGRAHRDHRRGGHDGLRRLARWRVRGGLCGPSASAFARPGGGAAFDGITGIYAVGILVPPGMEEPQPFAFCVDTLAPLPDAIEGGALLPSGEQLDAGGGDAPDASARP